MIRVLVVDDHDFLRAAVARTLSAAGGIEVVGECPDGRSALPAAVALNPDVVLMDMQMPGGSGIDATRDLIAVDPCIRVLIFTGSPDRRRLDDCVTVGARGYVVKSGDSEALVSAVRTVASGGSVWP